MAKIQADSQADMTKEQVASQNNLAAIAAQMNARLQESQAQLAADLEIERAQAEYDVASQQIEHQNNMTEAAFNASQNGVL
jgi:hypothetical protein